MSDDSEVDGIVLAGGRGQRLGRPKAAARLGGQTLVERAVAMLAARCERVLVVARADVPLPPVSVAVVTDRPGPAGPLNALATGLAAAEAPRVLVLACDLPFAAPLLDALLARGGAGALVGAEADRPQPLCARYPRMAALAAAERLLAAGDLRAQSLPAALGAALIVDRWGALTNVNTPEDLALAGERLRASRPG